MDTRKNFGYTASVLKDSNRVTASSQVNWAGLSLNSFIIFDDDEEFYRAAASDVEKASYSMVPRQTLYFS